MGSKPSGQAPGLWSPAGPCCSSPAAPSTHARMLWKAAVRQRSAACVWLLLHAHMCVIADDILFTWDPGLLRRWLEPHAWSQCCPALAGRCQPCCQGLKFEAGHCSAGPAAAYPTAPGVFVPNSPVRTFLRVSNQINYNSGASCMRE